MTRTIHVAIPAYSGEIGAPTVVSLMRAVEEARALGAALELDIRAHDSFLTRGRNVLVHRFLESGADDLVFWDADVAAAPGDFTRLVSHPVDCVAGCYRARKDPELYVFRPLAADVDPATGLLEIEGVGAGFLRLTRAAVERTTAHFPDLWVHDCDHGRIAWLFDNDIVDHGAWSEDMTFFRRFREAGGRVWVDPELTLHHTGPKTFSGSYAAFWRGALAARTTPAELDEAEAHMRRLTESFASAA